RRLESHPWRQPAERSGDREEAANDRRWKSSIRRYPWRQPAQRSSCHHKRATEGPSSWHGDCLQWSRQAVHPKFHLRVDGDKESIRHYHGVEWRSDDVRACQRERQRRFVGLGVTKWQDRKSVV